MSGGKTTRTLNGTIRRSASSTRARACCFLSSSPTDALPPRRVVAIMKRRRPAGITRHPPAIRMTDTFSLSAASDYRAWLSDLKLRVERASQRAAASVNRELVIALLADRPARFSNASSAHGWGAKVIDQLARDLAGRFPTCAGFRRAISSTCARSPQAWPENGFVQQPAAQLPWFHVVHAARQAR